MRRKCVLPFPHRERGGRPDVRRPSLKRGDREPAANGVGRLKLGLGGNSWFSASPARMVEPLAFSPRAAASGKEHKKRRVKKTRFRKISVPAVKEVNCGLQERNEKAKRRRGRICEHLPHSGAEAFW